ISGAGEALAGTVTWSRASGPDYPDSSPGAASRARRARSCRRDSQRAERAAGFQRSKGRIPRVATRPLEARTAPRSTGARHHGVVDSTRHHREASRDWSPPCQDSIANPIPESNFQKYQELPSHRRAPKLVSLSPHRSFSSHRRPSRSRGTSVDGVRKSDEVLELREVAGLRDVREDSALQHLDRFVGLLLSGHDDDRDGLVERTNLLEKLEPVELFHLRVA